MAFTKITNVDTANKGVVGLPDTPGLSTHDMQAKFDELATDVIIPKHNSLIDELEATTAAGSIGAVATTHTSGANVKAVLDALDTYFTTLNTNMKTYVDGKDSATRTYVDGKVNPLISRMDNVESNVVAQNAKIFNVENVSSQALNLATIANTTAQSAEEDALTALQNVATIMTLIQLLLGHVYINTEDEDRLNCENGDRILMDY